MSLNKTQIILPFKVIDTLHHFQYTHNPIIRHYNKIHIILYFSPPTLMYCQQCVYL